MRGLFKIFKRKKEEEDIDLEEEFGEDIDIGIEEGKEEEISFEEPEVEPISAETPKETRKVPPQPVYPQQRMLPQGITPQMDLSLLDQKIDMIRFDIQRLSQRIDFLIQRIDYLITLIQQRMYG